MNKITTVIFFIICALQIPALAQHERIVPLGYNPTLHERKLVEQENATLQNARIASTYKKYFYFQTDTLQLPFIDDFSRDLTADYRNYAYPASAQYEINNFLNFSVSGNYQDSVQFSTDTTYRYYIQNNQIYRQAYAPFYIDSFGIKNNVPPFDIPIKNVQAWPPYYQINFDTTGGIITKKADSVLVVQNTWYLDTSIIHVVKMSGKAGNYLDNKVFVNNSFPIHQPTQGVATFDGLSNEGLPYNNFVNPAAYGLADVLTSKPINLFVANGVNDSVYFSFYYQPKGYGNAPNASQDSLVLEFKAPSDTGWTYIWKAEGDSTGSTYFKWINIPLTQLKFLKTGFQFRFKNYATLSGAFDHWHIDYIYINKSRTYNDKYLEDVAFINNNQNLLNGYTNIPYKQYQKSMFKSSFDNYVTNLSNPAGQNGGEKTSKTNYSLVDNFGTTVYQYVDPVNNASVVLGAGVNTPATNTVGFNNLLHPPIAATAQYADSQVCKYYTMKQFVTFGQDVNKNNDTVSYKQYVANFLSYDDGTAEAGYELKLNQFLPEGKLAYQVELTTPDALTAVRYYFLPQVIDARVVDFKITIWEDDGAGKPGAIKYEETPTVNPTYGVSTNFFHEYTLTTPVNLSAGKYYIGLQQNVTTNLNLGLDLNTISTTRMYYNAGLGWNQSIIKGSWMLRPVFGTCPFETGSAIGLQETASNATIIYPNPANEQVSVETPINSALQVYDYTGKLIQNSITTNETTTITTANWTNGVYLIKINNNTSSTTHKLVVAH
ncbi:MAG: T9SS type A sorting domain-containing protein [Bacteroidia bacterium]